MAELQQKESSGGKGKPKKKSTRIDMTAMVDVAFLLLTFFILTTTMATPKQMEVVVPPKQKEERDPEDYTKKVQEEKVLTVILGSKDRVHYYVGITNPTIITTNFSDKGIRKVIYDHIYTKALKYNGYICGGEIKKNCWDPIIVIKPHKRSRYKNIVDILDEMHITAARKYALTQITPVDSVLLRAEGLY